MSKDTSIPKTLAIGFSEVAVNCDKAKFFGPDTIKGYDLILLDAKNFLKVESFDELDASKHKVVGKYIKSKVAKLHDWISRGSVLVIFPALAFQAMSKMGDVYSLDE